MKKPHLLLLALVLLGCGGPKPELATPPALGPAGSPGPDAWVQLGDGGAAQIRAVTAGTACPQALVDGQPVPLSVRAPADDKWALLCTAPLPPGARSVSLDGISLGVPTTRVNRILVLGDTGCRLKDEAIQSCNDPRQWPFATLAAAGAKLRPDLVVDVGDYQYRETQCPPGNAGCAGTPYGDNWPTWKADFFDPAAPLLKVAPWIFVRGNHEECRRAGRGYLRLIGPLAFSADCAAHIAPYRVPLGGLSLVVMDNSDADDAHMDAALRPAYDADLAEIRKPSPVPEWLVMHRPIWGAMTGPAGIPIGGNAQIIDSVERLGHIGKPAVLMLSGHVHTFEALNYDDGTAPPQIVGGNGGDNLDPAPANLKGTIFQGHAGITVHDGLSVGGFGFLLMTRSATGWTIDMYDVAGVAEGRCVFIQATDRVDCPELPAMRH